MLEFLFGSPEMVDFVELDGRKLTFRCRKVYKVNQTARIRTQVPTENGPHPMQLPVIIRSVRRLQDGSKDYVVASEVPATGNNQLEAVRMLINNLATADTGKGARRRPRYKLSLRTLSKDFPGFKALSIDFNALGLQVQTEGPLPEGKELTLEMELEKAEMPRVLCRAVVRWCTQVERKRYFVGLEFINLPSDIEAELQEFEKFIVSRQTGEVFQRTLGLGQVGEFELPGYQNLPETRTVSLGLNPPPPPPS